jgi:hypothetical protein
VALTAHEARSRIDQLLAGDRAAASLAAAPGSHSAFVSHGAEVADAARVAADIEAGIEPVEQLVERFRASIKMVVTEELVEPLVDGFRQRVEADQQKQRERAAALRDVAAATGDAALFVGGVRVG